MAVTRIKSRSIQNKLVIVWDIVMHVDLSLATEVINIFHSVLSAMTTGMCSVSHVVAGQSNYMLITQIILALCLLGRTLILSISDETLNEYVVEEDDKLDMELDNAPEYKYLE